MEKKNKPHYVNNQKFSQAVVEYVRKKEESREKNLSPPVIPNYVAECFLKIAEGLSHKSNFVRYTYREEMVMDAVENCLKAIENYNLEAATRSGTPNAFAYFTQISWYAFLRRINREKRQQEIKLRYISEAGIDNFMERDEEDNDFRNEQPFVDFLRNRIDIVRESDDQFKEYAKEEKKRRRAIKADSDLSEFLED